HGQLPRRRSHRSQTNFADALGQCYRAGTDTGAIARERLAADAKARDTIMNRAGSRISMPLLAAAMLAGMSLRAPASAQELRIGFIAPKTGIFAQLGIDMQNGFQMYLDEHKGELGGAKVSLIVEDDQGRPDTGVTKANKLILSDNVHMLVGGVLATTGYAL